jgi:hypothetical protein
MRIININDDQGVMNNIVVHLGRSRYKRIVG